MIRKIGLVTSESTPPSLFCSCDSDCSCVRTLHSNDWQRRIAMELKQEGDDAMVADQERRRQRHKHAARRTARRNGKRSAEERLIAF